MLFNLILPAECWPAVEVIEKSNCGMLVKVTRYLPLFESPYTYVPLIDQCSLRGSLTGSNAGITSVQYDQNGSLMLAASNGEF